MRMIDGKIHSHRYIYIVNKIYKSIPFPEIPSWESLEKGGK
jgi:hypothetical protein